MHLVMGNVAGHVVRSADCPVLTVRGPNDHEAAKARTRPGMVAAGLIAGLLLTPLAAAAQTGTAPQTIAGGELYRMYCAVCHGAAGRGDGPLAASMTRKPADLTAIAARNGGLFPTELVFRTIDGKNPVRGHGGPDMPVWGDAFARSRDGGDPATVKRMIQSLVDYLESIQLRVVHER
jgi:mono/diheme cytochrome c family protein